MPSSFIIGVIVIAVLLILGIIGGIICVVTGVFDDPPPPPPSPSPPVRTLADAYRDILSKNSYTAGPYLNDGSFRRVRFTAYGTTIGNTRVDFEQTKILGKPWDKFMSGDCNFGLSADGRMITGQFQDTSSKTRLTLSITTLDMNGDQLLLKFGSGPEMFFNRV